MYKIERRYSKTTRIIGEYATREEAIKAKLAWTKKHGVKLWLVEPK